MLFYISRNASKVVPKLIEDMLQKCADSPCEKKEELALLWIMGLVVPHVKPLDEDKCVKALKTLVPAMLTTAKQHPESRGAYLD